MSDSAIDRLINKRKSVKERTDDLLTNEPEIKAVEMYAKIFVRIDDEINSGVKALCLKHKISRETFFEAACAYLLSNPESLAIVVDSARQRGKQRKDDGIKKRANSMASHR